MFSKFILTASLFVTASTVTQAKDFSHLISFRHEPAIKELEPEIENYATRTAALWEKIKTCTNNQTQGWAAGYFSGRRSSCYIDEVRELKNDFNLYLLTADDVVTLSSATRSLSTEPSKSHVLANPLLMQFIYEAIAYSYPFGIVDETKRADSQTHPYPLNHPVFFQGALTFLSRINPMGKMKDSVEINRGHETTSQEPEFLRYATVYLNAIRILWNIKKDCDSWGISNQSARAFHYLLIPNYGPGSEEGWGSVDAPFHLLHAIIESEFHRCQPADGFVHWRLKLNRNDRRDLIDQGRVFIKLGNESFGQ